MEQHEKREAQIARVRPGTVEVLREVLGKPGVKPDDVVYWQPLPGAEVASLIPAPQWRSIAVGTEPAGFMGRKRKPVYVRGVTYEIETHSSSDDRVLDQTLFVLSETGEQLEIRNGSVTRRRAATDRMRPLYVRMALFWPYKERVVWGRAPTFAE